MSKIKMLALALGMGIGLNAMFMNDANARPDLFACAQLDQQCQAGDQTSCQTYNQFCKECELFPDFCQW